MAITFPSIEPTARVFSAPRWPTTSVLSQSGVSTTRLWGSRSSQAELRLTFSNITDDNAALIAQAYNSAKGATIDLTLPSVIFNGASANLKTWLDMSATGSGVKWFFADGETPSIESIAPGRSTVTIQLRAELRMS